MEFATFSFYTPPHTLTIWGGIKVFRPPKFYLQTKHKKWIFSATIHLTRKRFIFPGRYLKADHFEKKLDMGGGRFKNAEGQRSKKL